MDKSAAIAAASIVAVGLGVGGYFALQSQSSQCTVASVAGGTAAIGGPFEMVDHRGETVTDADVITGPSLVYFGYTYCPDVCPFDVTRNVEAIDILNENGHSVKPIFVTIDPARDTPEALSDYVENIYSDMVGLTGSQAQVDGAIKAYRAYARKNGEGEDYLMDHSTFSYLMTPVGFVDFFRRDLTPEMMAEKISCHL